MKKSSFLLLMAVALLLPHAATSKKRLARLPLLSIFPSDSQSSQSTNSFNLTSSSSSIISATTSDTGSTQITQSTPPSLPTSTEATPPAPTTSVSAISSSCCDNQSSGPDASPGETDTDVGPPAQTDGPGPSNAGGPPDQNTLQSQRIFQIVVPVLLVTTFFAMGFLLVRRYRHRKPSVSAGDPLILPFEQSQTEPEFKPPDSPRQMPPMAPLPQLRPDDGIQERTMMTAFYSRAAPSAPSAKAVEMGTNWVNEYSGGSPAGRRYARHITSDMLVKSIPEMRQADFPTPSAPSAPKLAY